MPVKDPERAHPVPRVWRPVLVEIVEAMACGTYDFGAAGAAVTCSASKKKFVQAIIADFGGTLTRLPAATWKTSMAQWMEGFWDVIVDLWVDSRPSDLVLFVRVTEGRDGTCRFRIDSVHVP